ncbi:hypothetical protein LAZ67_7000927, partial [Cordylochernes scorpioides]
MGLFVYVRYTLLQYVTNLNGIFTALVFPNRRITIREVSEETGVSFGICPSIIHDDLGIKQQYCKFVPRVLTLGQKETRKETLKLALQDQICQHKGMRHGPTATTSKQNSNRVNGWQMTNWLRPKRARMEKSEMKVLAFKVERKGGKGALMQKGLKGELTNLPDMGELLQAMESMAWIGECALVQSQGCQAARIEGSLPWCAVLVGVAAAEETQR